MQVVSFRGTAVRATGAGSTSTVTTKAVSTGVVSAKRGAFRVGKTDFTVRMVTPEEQAKLALKAKVQAKPLNPNLPVFKVGDEATYIQAPNAAAAADMVADELAEGNVDEERIESKSFFTRKFLNIPVWAWLGGGAAIAGGGVFLARRRRG